MKKLSKKRWRKNQWRNIFEGSDAVMDFMNPDNHPPIPIVELPDNLNPFSKTGVRIFAKLMYLLPLLNLKQLPAFLMLQKAKISGVLHGVHTVVEASSGNTVTDLAFLAPLFGIKRVMAIVPSDIAPGKLEMLRLSDAEFILHKEGKDEKTGKIMETAIQRAKRMGQEKGFLNLAQYENVVNPEAHEQWTAEQIWDQTDGEISVFCAGLGTAGTIVGAREYFKKKGADVTLVGAILKPGEAIPGVRTLERLKEGIRFDYTNNIHHVEVGRKESFRLSLKLNRNGFLAGPSSGFALAGLHRFLEEQQKDPALWQKLHNNGGEILAVVIFGDTPYPYLDKYSSELNASEY